MCLDLRFFFSVSQKFIVVVLYTTSPRQLRVQALSWRARFILNGNRLYSVHSLLAMWKNRTSLECVLVAFYHNHVYCLYTALFPYIPTYCNILIVSNYVHIHIFHISYFHCTHLKLFVVRRYILYDT